MHARTRARTHTHPPVAVQIAVVRWLGHARTHTRARTRTHPPVATHVVDGQWRPAMTEVTPPFRRWRDIGRSLLHSNKQSGGRLGIRDSFWCFSRIQKL